MVAAAGILALLAYGAYEAYYFLRYGMLNSITLSWLFSLPEDHVFAHSWAGVEKILHWTFFSADLSIVIVAATVFGTIVEAQNR